MKRFVNIIIILIGAFLLVCVVFIESLSHDAAGWLGFVGFVLVILGWCANTFSEIKI